MAYVRMSPAELVAAGYSEKSMRYRDTDTGESVSRRTVLNEQATSVGYRSYSQFQSQIKEPGYRKALLEASKGNANHPSIPISRLRSITNADGLRFNEAWQKMEGGSRQDKIDFFEEWMDWDVSDMPDDWLDDIITYGSPKSRE